MVKDEICLKGFKLRIDLVIVRIEEMKSKEKKRKWNVLKNSKLIHCEDQYIYIPYHET